MLAGLSSLDLVYRVHFHEENRTRYFPAALHSAANEQAASVRAHAVKETRRKQGETNRIAAAIQIQNELQSSLRPISRY
jgi:hypothetical protein